MKEAYTTTATIVLDEDGILRITIKKNAKIELADAENHFIVTKRLLGGKKGIVFLDAREPHTVSSAARKFGSDNYESSRIATAVLVSGSTIKYLSNIILYLQKPKTPVRMFTDMDEAIGWLKSLR